MAGSVGPAEVQSRFPEGKGCHGWGGFLSLKSADPMPRCLSMERGFVSHRLMGTGSLGGHSMALLGLDWPSAGLGCTQSRFPPARP